MKNPYIISITKNLIERKNHLKNTMPDKHKQAQKDSQEAIELIDLLTRDIQAVYGEIKP